MKKKLLAMLLMCVLVMSACDYIVVEDGGETQVRRRAARAEIVIDIPYTGLGSRDGEGEHEIADLQARLIALEYLTGEVTGEFDAATEEALIAFQWQYGLEETGVLDEATEAALLAEEQARESAEAAGKVEGALSKGDRDGEGQHAVADLQARLIELNFLGGEADGIFGGDTEVALMMFQKQNGLPETGIYDEMTQTALSGDAAAREGLVKGDRDGEGEHAVADMQARLIELDYLIGEADGIFGGDTQAALKAFQRQNGLSETGMLDPETGALLAEGGKPNQEEPVNAPAPVSKGDRDGEGEHAVADLQARLIELKYLGGKADGIFGADTEAALIAFQKQNGLAETGILDKNTAQLLAEGGEANKGDVVNPPPPLHKGDRDGEGEHAVADVQERLIDMNYLGGRADGIFGKGTEAALLDFQDLNGLEKTGVVDDATEAALASPDAIARPLAKGVVGRHVTEVQSALKIYGFFYSLADSVFEDKTDAAVKSFQQYQYDHGLLEAKPLPTPTPAPAADEAEAPETDEAEAPATDEAEAADGYVPDGVVDDQLMAMLTDGTFEVFREELSTGSQGREVERLQYRLTDLDYLGDAIDGKFGPMTREALEYFQKVNKLEQTGVADEATQRLLFSDKAVKSDKPINKFLLKVSVKEQRVYAYRWANGDYNKLVRTMTCSTGTEGHETPLGTYRAAGPAGRWYYFQKYKCWAQYAYRIDGAYLFHSVIYSEKNEDTVRWGSVYALGGRASHGCVRLSVEDAKWIFENCPSGTTVKIY